MWLGFVGRMPAMASRAFARPHQNDGGPSCEPGPPGCPLKAIRTKEKKA